MGARNIDINCTGKKEMTGRLLLLLTMILALVGLTACNTVAGFGRDITDSANAVKRVVF
jgi:predicted small secreted protein